MKPGFTSSLGEWERMNAGCINRPAPEMPCQALADALAEVTEALAQCYVEKASADDDPRLQRAQQALTAWNTRKPCDAGLREADWQPIETAPKDGTRLLTYSQDLTTFDPDPLPPFISVCAWHPNAGFCTDEIRQPTHWRPLPDPPALSKGDATR